MPTEYIRPVASPSRTVAILLKPTANAIKPEHITKIRIGVEGKDGLNFGFFI